MAEVGNYDLVTVLQYVVQGLVIGILFGLAGVAAFCLCMNKCCDSSIADKLGFSQHTIEQPPNRKTRSLLKRRSYQYQLQLQQQIFQQYQFQQHLKHQQLQQQQEQENILLATIFMQEQQEMLDTQHQQHSQQQQQQQEQWQQQWQQQQQQHQEQWQQQLLLLRPQHNMTYED